MSAGMFSGLQVFQNVLAAEALFTALPRPSSWFKHCWLTTRSWKNASGVLESLGIFYNQESENHMKFRIKVILCFFLWLCLNRSHLSIHSLPLFIKFWKWWLFLDWSLNVICTYQRHYSWWWLLLVTQMKPPEKW